MIDQPREDTSDDAASTRLTPESLLNLIVKAIGLFWFVYGTLTCVETVYAWYLGRFVDTTVYTEYQPYTTVWGVAMLAVGALLIVYSKRVTRIAYAFDQVADSADDAG